MRCTKSIPETPETPPRRHYSTLVTLHYYVITCFLPLILEFILLSLARCLESRTMSAEDFLQSEFWCAKMVEAVFKKEDRDNDGLAVPGETHEIIMAEFRKMEGIDQKLLDAYEASTKEMTPYLSRGPTEPLNKEDWLKMIAKIAADDLTRMERGEAPLFVKVFEAMFDLMDTDRDGIITCDVFKRFLVISGWDEETAGSIVQGLDKNKLGKLSREELIKSQHDFWYNREADKSQAQ